MSANVNTCCICYQSETHNNITELEQSQDVDARYRTIQSFIPDTLIPAEHHSSNGIVRHPDTFWHQRCVLKWFAQTDHINRSRSLTCPICRSGEEVAAQREIARPLPQIFPPRIEGVQGITLKEKIKQALTGNFIAAIAAATFNWKEGATTGQALMASAIAFGVSGCFASAVEVSELITSNFIFNTSLDKLGAFVAYLMINGGVVKELLRFLFSRIKATPNSSSIGSGIVFGTLVGFGWNAQKITKILHAFFKDLNELRNFERQLLEQHRRTRGEHNV